MNSVDVFGRRQVGDPLDRIRLGQDRGIFHRDLGLEMAEVGARVAFDHVKPLLLVETDPADHQRVAFPVTGVVPVPRRHRVFRMGAAIQIK